MDAKLYADEHGANSSFNTGFDVQMVNHAETYVRDQVHTNSLENFWSLLTPTIGGTYISITSGSISICTTQS